MPRAAKIKSITAKLTPEQKRHYDNLMAARDAVSGRVSAYAEDALDCSNADKRGVTTHMADMGSASSRHEMGLQLMREEGAPPTPGVYRKELRTLLKSSVPISASWLWDFRQFICKSAL